MTVVGFNFNKINVERAKPLQGKISINNNISIKGVENKDLSLGSAKQSGLKVAFEYGVVYSNEAKEKLANLDLEGEVLLLEQDAKVKDIVKDWDKSKKLSKEMTMQVLQTALSKCNIQAIILSRDLNLPTPIPLPKVEVDEKAPA
ncbi:MAG: hypothetical protein WC471_00140 [Candidatus Woesearchaeota archaeon]